MRDPLKVLLFLALDTASYSKEGCCVVPTLSFVAHSGGCLNLISLGGFTALGVREKNGAQSQRKLGGIQP